MATLGVVINPMSGRDVRRVAARAGTSTHGDKSNQLARIIISAIAHGIERVVLTRDPFRIAEHAVENLPCRDQVGIESIPITHTDRDTESAVAVMRNAGCEALVTFGGDGTNRIVARAWPDVALLPLSTGTNNVFPMMVEPTVVGAATTLIATGKVPLAEAAHRAKQIHVSQGARRELALVDAVLLRDDILGSLLPFDSKRIAALWLTRAEPAAVGMSPIGGFIDPCLETDEWGLELRCGMPPRFSPHVPVSPGLFATVNVTDTQRLQFGNPVQVSTAGILAFDGDRTLEVDAARPATLTIRRDGPWVVDPRAVLEHAARQGLLI